MDGLRGTERYYPERIRRAITDVLRSGAFVREICLRAGSDSCYLSPVGEFSLLSQGERLQVTEQELNAVLSGFCHGSIYAYRTELAKGGLSLEYGIRIGICGRPVYEGGKIVSLSRLRSLCIRYPLSDRPPPAGELIRYVLGGTMQACEDRSSQECKTVRSVLLYGKPACGKTTALRSILSEISVSGSGKRCAVIDSSGELFGSFDHSRCLTDFFVGYEKYDAITRAIRFFAPKIILCDEIGDEADCEALRKTQHSGIAVIATAHAETVDDLKRRPGIRNLLENNVFDGILKIEIRNGKYVLAEGSA